MSRQHIQSQCNSWGVYWQRYSKFISLDAAFHFREALRRPTINSWVSKAWKTKHSTNSPFHRKITQKENYCTIVAIYGMSHLRETEQNDGRYIPGKICALNTMVPRHRVLMHTYYLWDLQSSGVFAHSHLHNPITYPMARRGIRCKIHRGEFRELWTHWP